MKHLLIFMVLSLSVQAQTTKIIGSADIQHYWPFEEGTGTTTNDRISGGTNGTITGATWTTGVIGKALTFNGSSQYVTFGTTFRPANTQPFSVSCWFTNTNVNSTQQIIFGNIVTATSAGIDFGINASNKFIFYFASTFASGYREGISTATVTQGGWHFGVGTWDGSAKATVYLDGVANANSTVVGTVTAITYANNTTIGRNDGGANQYWTGQVDDFKCYNHEMTNSEVSYLFYCGRQQPTNN